MFSFCKLSLRLGSLLIYLYEVLGLTQGVMTVPACSINITVLCASACACCAPCDIFLCCQLVLPTFIVCNYRHPTLSQQQVSFVKNVFNQNVCIRKKEKAVKMINHSLMINLTWTDVIAISGFHCIKMYDLCFEVVDVQHSEFNTSHTKNPANQPFMHSPTISIYSLIKPDKGHVDSKRLNCW